MWPDRQATVVGVPTWTPVPSQIQPAPTRPSVQIVEVMPQETEADRRIMEILDKLIIAMGNLATEVHVASGSQAPQQPVADAYGGPGVTASAEADKFSCAHSCARCERMGGWKSAGRWRWRRCCTCAGRTESDGYVIRWVGVQGDNTGSCRYQTPTGTLYGVRATGLCGRARIRARVTR